MNKIDLLTALDQLQPCSVWIESTVLNNGCKDIREFPAKTVSQDNFKIFILNDTLRNLQDNFTLDVGSVLHDGTGFYKCIQVSSFEKMNKTYTVLLIERNT